MRLNAIEKYCVMAQSSPMFVCEGPTDNTFLYTHTRAHTHTYILKRSGCIHKGWPIATVCSRCTVFIVCVLLKALTRRVMDFKRRMVQLCLSVHKIYIYVSDMTFLNYIYLPKSMKTVKIITSAEHVQMPLTMDICFFSFFLFISFVSFKHTVSCIGKQLTVA